MPLSLVVCTAGTPASNLLFPILAHLPKRDRFILAGNNWDFAFSQMKPAEITCPFWQVGTIDGD